MTDDKIIEMAKQNGIPLMPEKYEQNLIAFARLIEREVREECVVICSENAKKPSTLWAEEGCWKHASEYCAAAIRVRG